MDMSTYHKFTTAFLKTEPLQPSSLFSPNQREHILLSPKSIYTACSQTSPDGLATSNDLHFPLSKFPVPGLSFEPDQPGLCICTLSSPTINEQSPWRVSWRFCLQLCTHFLHFPALQLFLLGLVPTRLISDKTSNNATDFIYVLLFKWWLKAKIKKKNQFRPK